MTASSDQHLYPDGLVACHECDAVHRLHPLGPHERAYCTRCGAMLYRDVHGSLDKTLALAAAAVILLVLANSFPFIGLKIEARVEENLVISGVFALWQAGMPDLAILVLVTSIVFPAVTVLGMFYLLLGARLDARLPGLTLIYRVIHALGPWTLLGVFMLGALIAFVKLADLATVIPGVSLYALGALMVTAAAVSSRFDPSLLWPRVGPRLAQVPAGAMAAELGMMSCHTCDLLMHEGPDHGTAHCPRCATAVHGLRKGNSITRTWALVIAAGLLIVPANVYPVMTVIRFGQGEPATIMQGVIQLIAEGMWGLAFIVFFASIVVPTMKLALLVFLLLSVQWRSQWRPRDRTRLYRITEVVGAWSMVDIFLVGVLSALVQLDALASIEPGIGASYFGAVVVITMLAAHSFDPRLIWDNAKARA